MTESFTSPTLWGFPRHPGEKLYPPLGNINAHKQVQLIVFCKQLAPLITNSRS